MRASARVAARNGRGSDGVPAVQPTGHGGVTAAPAPTLKANEQIAKADSRRKKLTVDEDQLPKSVLGLPPDQRMWFGSSAR